MDDILKLVYILEQKLDFGGPDWTYVRTKLNGVQKQLLDQVLEDRGITDKQAALGYNSSTPQNASYRHSKRKLKDSLLTAINGYNPSTYYNSKFHSVYYKSHKLHHAFKILSGFSYPHLASTIGEQLLTTARKYQITDVCIEVAQYLSLFYYTVDPNIKKADEYAKIAQDCVRIRLAEVEIEQLYAQFMSKFVKKKSVSPKTLDEFVSKIQYYNQYHINKIPSYKFYLRFYLIHLNIAMVYEDDSSLLKYARAGYKYFCDQNYDHNLAKSIFINHMSSAYLRMNQMQDARDCIQESIQYSEEGRPNWFKTLYHLMQIEIANRDYQIAYQYYQEMIANRNFEDQVSDRREVYRLYGTYLEFLCLINVVNGENKPTQHQINRITRHKPEFARDQKGMKIPIIIGQLLFHIHDKNYDAIIDKIDSLKDYCSRHLVRKSPYYRSHCFIKMLLLIPVNLFNPVAVKRKGEVFLNRLKLVPHTITEKQSLEIEIIPYEDLWEFVLKYLEKPKRVSERLKAYRYE